MINDDVTKEYRELKEFLKGSDGAPRAVVGAVRDKVAEYEAVSALVTANTGDGDDVVYPPGKTKLTKEQYDTLLKAIKVDDIDKMRKEFPGAESHKVDSDLIGAVEEALAFHDAAYGDILGMALLTEAQRVLAVVPYMALETDADMAYQYATDAINGIFQVMVTLSERSLRWHDIGILADVMRNLESLYGLYVDMFEEPGEYDIVKFVDKNFPARRLVASPTRFNKAIAEKRWAKNPMF